MAVDPSCDPSWLALSDRPLLDALYAELSGDYRPIAVELDLGGNPNRYTTARRLMFTVVERRSQGVYLLYVGTLYGLAEGAEPPHNVINTEHSWPRSRLASEQTDPAAYEHQQSDLHHLYPTLAAANSARGSLPYGEAVSDLDLSFSPSLKGRDASGREVFEPRDEVKGDLARTLFYMSARWGLALEAYEEEVLRRWHTQDPPDDWERIRDGRVAALQGNRNVFIDCPALVPRVADFMAIPRPEALPLP
jgi:hypothetical protein